MQQRFYEPTGEMRWSQVNVHYRIRSSLDQVEKRGPRDLATRGQRTANKMGAIRNKFGILILLLNKIPGGGLHYIIHHFIVVGELCKNLPGGVVLVGLKSGCTHTLR